MSAYKAGPCRVVPVLLRRDQHLDVHLDHEGRFIGIAETMPPLTNYARIRGIDAAHELALRTKEWEDLERAAFQGVS